MSIIGNMEVMMTTPRAQRDVARVDCPDIGRGMSDGYAASFLRALQDVAARDTLAIPPGFGLEVELRMALPGLSHRAAETLVNTAHVVCPYSNATRGNMPCAWCSCAPMPDGAARRRTRWPPVMPRPSRNAHATLVH